MQAPEKFTWPDPITALLYFGGALIVLMLLLRVAPGLAATLGLLLLMSAPYVGYQVWRAHRTAAPAADPYSFGGRVQQRYADCVAKEERFREEAERIRLSIVTLREDLERSNDATDQEAERARALIKDFEAEFNLRHAKAAFFGDCAAKLKALLDRHRLQESIAARRRELDDLRQTNFDDEAALEETRYHLEQDTRELDTIAELSQEAFASFKAEQAEELRERLEALRGRL